MEYELNMNHDGKSLEIRDIKKDLNKLRDSIIENSRMFQAVSEHLNLVEIKLLTLLKELGLKEKINKEDPIKEFCGYEKIKKCSKCKQEIK